MRISDWSSDVCSSDLGCDARATPQPSCAGLTRASRATAPPSLAAKAKGPPERAFRKLWKPKKAQALATCCFSVAFLMRRRISRALRSEEHTSELQSLMRISYAVFCLKNKNRLLQHT